MKAGAAVHVRRMNEADLDRVMAIAADLKDAPHWKPEAYRAALDAAGTPRRIALVAERIDQAALSGFAVASVVTPQAELESIAVVAAGQGQGTGRRLLDALAGELRQIGVVEVLLEVRASNQNAIGFYRKLGWSETGRRPRYYAVPEEDAVLMSWTLG